MRVGHPETEDDVRKQIDRLLRHAGWLESEIGEEENVGTGRMDYRLGDLCILEAKRPTPDGKPYLLKLHLQQPQRYRESARHIPFLMVSDGSLHFLQDARTGHVERVFSLPSPEQLRVLLDDPEALQDGYVLQHSGLFDFQKRALYAAIHELMNGRTRLLFEMATGTGKTVVAAHILTEMNRIIRERENRRAKVLFLVDRDALEEQAAERLAATVKGLKVKTIEDFATSRADVLVAQVATMQHRYDKPPFTHDMFDLIVVDEAHRSVHGESWRKVVESFDCPQIGLTATPPRFTDDETVAYFGEPVFLYSYKDGVRDGVLAPSIIHRVKTTIDRDGLKVGNRLFTSEDFGVVVQVANRDWTIVRYYERHFYGKKCLVFAASTEHVESLWSKFNDMFAEHPDGYKAQFVISSHESAAARSDIIRQFEHPDSAVRVLINLNILTAGFDYPELDLLFMCRYTRHKSLYLQMKGRGSRIPVDRNGHIRVDERGDPLKDRFTMVDFVGVTDWEDKDFVPSLPGDDAENPAERVTSTDPSGVEGTLSSDVAVGIAEVKVIDPFEAMETPVVRHLREQLEATRGELAQERARREARENAIAALEREIGMVREASRQGRRDAFRQLVRALHAVAPFVLIMEDLLRHVSPTLPDLATLNDAFEVELGTIQGHIDAVLAGESEGVA